MLTRPDSRRALPFYDELLARGLVEGMTLSEQTALATPEEWRAYHTAIHAGWRKRAMDRRVDPLTLDADDEVARDERENPPHAGISAEQ